MLKEDERFVKSLIQEAGGLPEILTATLSINQFRTTEHVSAKTGKPLEKKNARIQAWHPSDEDIDNIIIAVFTLALAHGPATMQTACGMLNHMIDLPETLDRVHIIASLIALIAKTDLIKIEKTGTSGYFMISTKYKLNKALPVVDRHGTVFHRPQPVESNWDPEQGSMLLGSKFNHHEGNICLDHINKMNSIPLSLNRAFIVDNPEKPKKDYFDPKDPAWKATQKKELWNIYEKQCKLKYAQLICEGNRFFLNHKYCTRGRTYATGYYINTQGTGYKKGMIELYHKEKLNPA